ncbi:patatin-like phospholipase family protein [Rhodopseudomonas palustris]|uniref:Patatin n=1 Tax=Rhodopseudomonas palustris (strain BisB18) TaxID=316056 RepID=Q217T6_RHOPB
MSDIPVRLIPGDSESEQPENAPALCLSGGGYRAMVFHIGALWRLYESGWLSKLKRISSVSGGSITAGFLGLQWSQLSFAPGTVQSEFVPKVVTPLRALASTTIDIPAVILGLLLPGGVAGRIAKAYDSALFNGKTLQDLPDAPRFVINATNMQSTVLWRFSKPYMWDYRVGEVKSPTLALAQAVAASSAFPPVLSPARLSLSNADFVPKTGDDLQRPPFTTDVILTDGGVYDNLGLETAWKRYKTILVSDAGGKTAAEESPPTDWLRQAYRVLNLINSQVRALRVRQLIDSYQRGADNPDDPTGRNGTYWGIRADIAEYHLHDALDCPLPRTTELANIATRLARLDDLTQQRLINWGYAIADAALRKYVDPDLQPKPAFPYPKAGV